MQVVIIHLTRMKYPRICVGGVDIDNRQRHIRLVTPPDCNFTNKDTHTFRLGNIVELLDPIPQPNPPEVEDVRVLQWQLKGTLPAEEFVAILESNARRSLEDIFGPSLTIRRNKPTMPVGTGTGSLGIIEPAWMKIGLQTTSDKLQLRCIVRFPFSNEYYNLSLTDLRFYRQENETWVPDPSAIEESRALQKRSRVLLGVGLTRPWAPSEDHEPCHWLQVNNVHHLSEPYWRR